MEIENETVYNWLLLRFSMHRDLEAINALRLAYYGFSLEGMPCEYAEQKELLDSTINSAAWSIPVVLQNAFIWDLTPQKHRYWEAVQNYYSDQQSAAIRAQ